MKLAVSEQQIWALDSAISSINAAKDMEQLTDIILTKTVHGFGAQAGILFFLNNIEHQKRQIKFYHQNQIQSETIHTSDYKQLEKIIKSGAPLIEEKSKPLKKILENKLGCQPKSILYIPLTIEDNLLGVLGLFSPNQHFFTKRSLSWFSFCGRQLALAVNKVLLEIELKKSVKELSVLSEVTNIMGHMLDLDEMLQLVLYKILNLFQLDAGGIYILNENKQLKRIASKGLPEFLLEFIRNEYKHNKGLSTQILASDTPVIITDFNKVSDSLKILSQNGYHCFLGIPIKSKNSVWGMIIMLGKNGCNAFNSAEKDMLCTIANEIAAIMENKFLFNQVVRAKKEWENTFDSITDMVSILDQNFNVLRVNKAFAQKFNKHPRELINTKCYNLFHPEVGPIPDCPCIKTLTTGKPFSKELRIKTLNGNYIIHTSEIMDPNSKQKRFAHIVRDITAKKTLEHQLLQMQKMECIGNMAGGIAHDFNNLLDGIIGYAGYIQDILPRDDPLYKEIEAIKNIALKGTNLTHQLMDFGKRSNVDLIPIRINRVIQDVIKLLSRTIEKNIRIIKSLSPKLPLIEGDEGQLHQLILNICLNARDAMPQGGMLNIKSNKVFLDEKISNINPCLESGEYICISINDTGYGMQQDILDKIFDPFFTTRQKDKGTGLGLASAYRITKNHKGHIEVKSKPDHGATFDIYLPILPKKERIILKKEGNTILIVDNEELVNQCAQQILSQKGYKVLTAKNSQISLELLKENKKCVGLVILDLVIPPVNGEQTYNLVKKIKADIRILLSSNRSLTEHTKKALCMVTEGILEKPYKPDELISKVEQALGKVIPPLP